MKTTIQNITDLFDPDHHLPKQNETNQLGEALTEQYFIFLAGQQMYRLLLQKKIDLHEQWAHFKHSWKTLERDNFMADGGHYRLRRHATYRTSGADSLIELVPYKPHYQSLDHNLLNGGVERYFAPLEPTTTSNPILARLLELCRDVFCAMLPRCDWHIEVHQFRIETSQDSASPTPEGVHRDGVNFVFMMMTDRHQINGGTTFLYDPAGQLLQQHTMVDAMESAFINDEQILHGVSPITPAMPGQRGHRDMLVITFRRA